MQDLTLTTPVIVAPISVTTYRVIQIKLDWSAAFIGIKVRDSQGDVTLHTYTGATATTLMNQLNKLDMSSNSLHKRILERLVADGKLPAGTVTGAPD